MCPRTFQRGRQLGAWVMTLGLRAADGMDWRLQMNKPDPLIPMGQEVSPGDVSLADPQVTSAWRMPRKQGAPRLP